jgi:hypothetical protein
LKRLALKRNEFRAPSEGPVFPPFSFPGAALGAHPLREEFPTIQAGCPIAVAYLAYVAKKSYQNGVVESASLVWWGAVRFSFKVSQFQDFFRKYDKLPFLVNV